MVDPDEQWGGTWNPDVVPFESISSNPCLILLGEPGIGKSTALGGERDRAEERAASSGGDTHWVDLRAYQTDSRLHQDLFEAPALCSWRQGTRHLDLFLDSLDECRMRIDNVSAVLISELERLPVERLSLRIACRTAEWPSGLESALRRLWGSEAVKAFELAPLRRIDVAEAARVTGVDPNAFLSEVGRREAVPLAIKPVTLDFLLNTYRRRQGFPGSQAELYAEGCRCLCEETSQSRRDAKLLGELTAEQRLAVAARIAAITIFCNRHAIWTGVDQGDVPSEDIRLEDLVGGTEGKKDAAVAVNRDAIRETLDTGLFSSRGLNRIGWAHQTYGEFLAARFLVEHGLPPNRIMTLIVHPDGKIVPQLRETAAWLASMVAEVFRCITASDPEVLLRSDVATAEVKDRADLVEHLLVLYDHGKLVDSDWDLIRMYRKLNHPSLPEQLRPYIRDKQKDIVVRRVAIDIAEACEILALQEDLVQVALDETDSYAARVQAAFAISQMADDRAKQMLKPLAMGQGGDDPDDELKGCGLECVWPRFLTTAELIGALTPPKQPNLFGMYGRFLRSDIAAGLQPSDLPLTLKWVEDRGVGHAPDKPLGELADAILAMGLDHLDVPGIPEALAAAAQKWFRIHRGSVCGPHPSAFRAKLAENVERRRELVAAILPLLTDPQDRFFLIRPRVLTDSSDTFWLIDRLREAEAEAMQRLLAALIARTFDGRDVGQLDAVICASRESKQLAEQLSWLLEPVELDSPRAQAMKAEYAQMELEAKPTARPLLDPPPEQRIAVLLERFESGDLDAFWQLNRELTLEPDSTHYGDELEPDLTVLPGWRRSNPETKARIIAAAERYLETCDPEAEKWLGTDTITDAALAGYRALLLLAAESPTLVSTLPETVWGKWVPIILAHPLASGSQSDEPHHQLAELAYQRAPNAVLNTLLRLIDAENERHGTAFVFQRLEAVWDDRLAAMVLAKVMDASLKPEAFGVLLGELLRHEVPRAREIATSAIGTLPQAGGGDRERAVIAARELVLHAQDAGWGVVWPAVQRDTEFGLKVLSDITYRSRWAHRVPVAKRLTEQQLKDLFIWLARNVSFEDEPQGAVSPIQTLRWWRPSVLELLKGRGTAEACEGIRRAMAELPHLIWLKWPLLEAEQIARQRSWVPLQPKHLSEIVAHPQRRSVQTGEQLLAVLIESLERLNAELHGETPAATYLWNVLPTGVFRPKDEPALSDYIKLHLERDIRGRGIVVNREVQIRRGVGSSPGEQTDIHVDAVILGPGSGTYDRISAIVEVKGCWNRELMDAMQTQLAERYLKEHRCPFGLYVVGWFACDQWDDDDYRKGQTPTVTLQAAQDCFDRQARELSSGLRHIKAFVLNAALR